MRVGGSLYGETFQRAADHVLDEAVFGDFGDGFGADMLAVADHGDAVGDAEDLVQTVGDVDDGDALGFQGAGDVEEAGDLMGRKARGRFVHD